MLKQHKAGKAALLVALLGFAFTALAFAAGSGDGKPVKITVWSNNRHDLTYVQKKIAEFNEKNKGSIEIDYIVQTDNYLNMLIMANSSGQAPDIANVASSNSLVQLVEAGVPIALNKFITADFAKMTDLDHIKYEGINVIGDDIYYVPTCLRSGSRLIYNVDLFKKAGIKKAPATLAELVEDAAKITKVGEGKAYGCAIPGMSGPLERFITHCAEISGVTQYDYKSGTYKFDGFKPFILAARKIFEDGSMFPGAASMKVDPSRVQFAEGNVGFYGNASQEVGVLTTQFPAKIPWGVAPLPSLSGEIKGALSTNPQMGWIISKQSKNPELAWKVVEFFSGPDFLVGYTEAGMNILLSPSIRAKADMSKAGRLADFAPLPYESVYPTAPEVSLEGKNWMDALWEACLPGGPSVDKVIADLNRDYNSALDRDVKMGKIKRLVIKDYDPLRPNAGKATYLTK